MAISFCGIDLLLPDAATAAFIDAYLPAHATNWFIWQSPSQASLKQISMQRHPARVPMPAFNWPAPPRPRINTLYIPVTGATRWSVGLFLVDDDRRAKIQAAIGSDSSGDLVAGDGTTTRTATMYLLTPHAVTPPESPDLYILPLVDTRYFWQFDDVGDLTMTNGATAWSDIITEMLPTAVQAHYFKPDPLEFARLRQNTAQLFDAQAASTGRRLVVDLFAKSRAMQCPTDAEAAYAKIYDKKVHYAAGGEQDATDVGQGLIPTQVRVLFPEHVGNLPSGSGSLYAKTISASEGIAPTVVDQPSGDEWCIFSTAAADLTGYATGHNPWNQTDLDNLATQISTDLYAWTKRAYDLVCIGLWPFSPTGYEDYHLIDLRGRISTRIATLPPNVMPHTNWCQIGINSAGDDTNTHQNELWPGPRLRVELKTDLGGSTAFSVTPGQTATCYVREWNGSALVKPQSGGNDDTGKVITAVDVIGQFRALGRDSTRANGGSTDGAYAIVEWHSDAERWEFVTCQQISQKIKVSIGTGCVAGGATFTPTSLAVMDPGGQDVSNSGASYPTITNYSTYIGNCSSGAVGIVCLWDESIPGYLVVDAPCPDPNCGSCPS